MGLGAKRVTEAARGSLRLNLRSDFMTPWYGKLTNRNKAPRQARTAIKSGAGASPSPHPRRIDANSVPDPVPLCSPGCILVCGCCPGRARKTRPPRPPAAATPTQVRVTTNMGDFVIEVRADRAPLTAANFLRYVREGFYNEHPDPPRGGQLRDPGRRYDATT